MYQPPYPPPDRLPPEAMRELEREAQRLIKQMIPEVDVNFTDVYVVIRITKENLYRLAVRTLQSHYGDGMVRIEGDDLVIYVPKERIIRM